MHPDAKLATLTELTTPEVVFIGFIRSERERWWDALTHPDFRHVFVWWRCQYARHPECEDIFVAVDPAAERDHVMILPEPAFAAWLDAVQGMASEIWRGVPENKGGPWLPATCVTAAMRICGLGWGAVRPQGLRKLLHTRGWSLVWTSRSKPCAETEARQATRSPAPLEAPLRAPRTIPSIAPRDARSRPPSPS